MYLQEAFRALDALNEDTFSVSDDGIKKLSEFEQNDDLTDEIAVIDMDAEVEDDLQTSYVGKVILDCAVCHSKLYKDKGEVNLNDDQTLANVGEECPYCYTSDGFKVIGEVAAFSEEGVEEPEETEETTETDKTDEEDLEEFLDANVTLDARGFGGKDNNVSVLGSSLPMGESLDEGIFDKFKKKKKEVDEPVQIKPQKRKAQYKDTDWVVVSDRGSGAYRYTYSGYYPKSDKHDAEEDKRRLDNVHKTRGLDKNPATSIDHFVTTYGEAKRLVGRPYKENLNQPSETLDEGIFDKFKKKKQSSDVIDRDNVKQQAPSEPEIKVYRNYKTYSYAVMSDGTFRKLTRYGDPQKTVYNSEESIKRSLDQDIANDEYYNNRPRRSYWEGLQEDVNNVNVETDDSIVNVSTDDDGKVTVTTEPVTSAAEAGEGDEMLAPLSDETEQEIYDNGEELPEDENVEEEEIDIEDFDEESFDELGESYLKSIYENVNSYKTSNVTQKGNHIKVEGIIGFNSGNQKKTSFIFEAKDTTRSGLIRFIGENSNITRGKKAFTLRGRVNDKKFITESFNYNYRTKNDEGKSTRVYGTLRLGKRG